MEGIIGYTTLFAGSFAPKNWALCNGQLMPIQQNTALFSILGTLYGGNGVSTFALPNLMGRAVIGAGQGPGLSFYDQGQDGGAESISLNVSQLPAHTHAIVATLTPVGSTGVSKNTPAGSVYGTGAEDLYSGTADSFMQNFQTTVTLGATGNGLPISALQPLLCLNYIICLQGVFPARN